MKATLKLVISLSAFIISSGFFSYHANGKDVLVANIDPHNININIRTELRNTKAWAITKPHPISWVDEHGISVKQEGTSSCTECHGTDLLGGKAEVSCYRCHGDKWDMPHPPFWMSEHGRSVSKFGASGCSQCHETQNPNSQIQNSNQAVSCSTCHGGEQDSTDPNFWVNGHGKYASHSGVSSCTQCHGNDLLGGKLGISCYRCHDKKW